jgi:hypothetical protein
MEPPRAASYATISAAPPLPRSRCFLRGGRARPCRALPCYPLGVSRQRSLRRCSTALALERAFRRAGAFAGRLFAAPSSAFCEIALCLTFCSFFAALRRRQFYSSTPSLRQSNGDRLLWRSGAVFTFPDVFHFFAHKLARLSRRRFAFALVFSRAFQCFLFGHIKSVSPLAISLDVEDCVKPQQPLLLRRDYRQFRACKSRPSRRADKNVAISRWAKLISAHAHNSNNCLAPALTRRTPNVAVQLRLGLLSKRRPRTDPLDRADPLADGADLNRTPRLNRVRRIWVELPLFTASRRSLT